MLNKQYIKVIQQTGNAQVNDLALANQNNLDLLRDNYKWARVS